MKRVLLAFLAVYGSLSMGAQIQQIVLDTVCTDCPIAGYTTVRVYAQTTNANDVVSTIFGLEGSPLSITTDCPDCFFNSSVGNDRGDQINCSLIPFFPDLEFDTWVTVGRSCSSDPGDAVFTLESPNEPWMPIDCEIVMSDVFGGAWFTTPSAINAMAGADLLILLGQFSTCGSLEICLNAQVFVEYDGPGAEYINQYNLCVSSTGCTVSGCTDPAALNFNVDACQDNGFCLFPCDLEITNVTVTPPTCSYGTNGSIDVDGTGSQGLLRFYNNGIMPNLNGVYNNLGNGTYTILLNDERFDDETYNPDGMYGTCQVDTVIVINTPAVAFTLGAADGVSCNGGSDACNVSTATGGTGSLDFQITNCSGTQFILDDLGNPLTIDTPEYCEFMAGSWRYVATDDNGCVFQSNCFTISQPPALNISSVFINAATCGDIADGGVNMQFLGGTGDVDFYIDTTFYELNFIQGLLPGTYIITGVDVNGCEDTAEVTIPGPTPVALNLSSTTTSCFGTTDGCINSLATGGNPGVYTYSIDSVNYSPVTEFCGLAAGTYTIFAQDSQGCADTNTIVVSQPDPLGVDVIVNDVACFGETSGSIVLQGTGGTPGYLYSLDSLTFTGNDTFEDLGIGEVTIYVTDDNGCTFQTTATLDQPDALTLSFEVDDALCAGSDDGQVVVDVTGGTPDFDYYIDGVLQSSNVIDDLEADTYTITVIDENGCEIEGDVTVDEPAEIEITVDGSTDETEVDANDGTIDISVDGGTGDYTFEWTNINNVVVSTDEDPTNLPPGTYNVTVTDENGCEVDLSTDVIIDDSMIELNASVGLSITPNPTSGLFVMTLTGLHGEKIGYTILDTRGRVIEEKELGNANGEKKEEIDLSGAEAGMYYMTVRADNATRTVKVVKE